MRILQPRDWPRPRGYANGVSARGRQVYVAGQIGWDERGELAGADLVTQARQALQNIVAILATDGARPEHLVRLTWYVLDKQEYLASLKDVGAAYRASGTWTSRVPATPASAGSPLRYALT